MDGGYLTKYFPTTGGRNEIAPYPTWATLYLLTMDNRLAEETLNYGDLSGSIPVHFRESDLAHSFYRHPVSVDDRPTIWTTYLDYQYIAPADQFPAAIGDLTTPWSVDLAHQPSLAYVPYLVSGDLYYLEEMHFWACFDLGASNSGYRGGTQCWLIDQVRGNGWAFRNIVDAAAMTPDTMPEKAYLNAKIANNITHWNSGYIINGKLADDSYLWVRGCQRPAGWLDRPEYLLHEGRHLAGRVPDPGRCSMPGRWGYPTLDLVHWGGRGLIDRFSDWPGWNRFRGAPYVMPIMGIGPTPYATWADVNNGFADKVGPSSFAGAYVGDYNYAARGDLALVAPLLGGQSVFTWLDTNLPGKTGLGVGSAVGIRVPAVHRRRHQQ